MGPCSLSQVVTAEMLRAWGEDGLDSHLRTIQREYAQRAACIAAAAERVRCCSWACFGGARDLVWLELMGREGGRCRGLACCWPAVELELAQGELPCTCHSCRGH